MVNILIADDHEVIRSGIKQIIENGMADCIFDEAEDGDSAFEKIKKRDYDILILDINMPRTDSFGLVNKILCLKPASRILMFSMNAENLYAEKYLKLGVKGYLRKDEPATTIIKAINTVLNGKRFVSESFTEKMLDDLQSKHRSENPFGNLTTRELEIAHQLISGNALRLIAETFNLHTSTLSTHKARIFKKLNCSNIVDLNKLARGHNFIFQS